MMTPNSTLRVGTQPIFAFESADTLAQFGIWVVLGAGGTIGGFFWFVLGGWWGVLIGLLGGVVLISGLRASITVTESEAVIIKKWFCVSYRTYSAPAIDDVWFGGDYGMEEGAVGVVIQLAGREIHIGTSRNMRELHDALRPLSMSFKIHDRY